MPAANALSKKAQRLPRRIDGTGQPAQGGFAPA